MKKQFSTSECEKIMEQVLELHDETCVNMYQPIKEPGILIAEVVSTGGTEIDKMHQMNLSVTLFAQDYHIQMWLMKN